VISKITGRQVFDGRGLTAVQTEVHCIIRNEEKVDSEIIHVFPAFQSSFVTWMGFRCITVSRPKIMKLTSVRC